MGKSSCNGSKSKSISKSKHDAQVNPSLLRILRLVQLEMTVDNGFDVVVCPVGLEQVDGIERERLCVVDVEPPVGDGHDHVDDEEVPDEDVGDGKEGGHERAEEEGGHHGPVEGEGS